MPEHEFGLVMPFVGVASNGGPFDDDAFAAGYECGKIDQALDVARRPLTSLFYPDTEYTVRTANLPQLDLIAMRHSYTMTAVDTEVDGWSVVRFDRGANG